MKKTTIFFSIMAVSCMAFIGSAKASNYYYFSRMNGLIKSSNKGELNLSFAGEEETGGGETEGGTLDVVLSAPDTIPMSTDDLGMSIDIGISSNNITDLSGVGLSIEFLDVSQDIINNLYDLVRVEDIWALGVTRFTEVAGSTDLKVTATLGEEVRFKVISVVVEEAVPFVCNSADPLSNIATDAEGNYLIGGALGVSSLAKKELLCLSTYQTADVLAATTKYKMTADVVFNSDEGAEDWNNDGSADGGSTEGWKPFHGFRGSFNGGGYKIVNLYINKSNFIGFIGRTMTGAVVKNLGLKNIDIVDGGSYVGGISGYADGTIIESCWVSGHVSGGYYVGGIVGKMCRTSSLSKSYVKAKVRGKKYRNDNWIYVGGLVGQLDGSGAVIENCYSNSDVYNDGYYLIGGLVGEVHSGSILNSYAAGLINSGNFVGPIIGFRYTGGYYNNALGTYWTYDNFCDSTDCLAANGAWSSEIWNNIGEGGSIHPTLNGMSNQ